MKFCTCLFIAMIAVPGCKKKEPAASGDPTAQSTEGAKPAESTVTTTTDCRRVQAHIFEITPESGEVLSQLPPPERQQMIDTFAAAVTDKEIKECMTYPKATVACMQAAPTLATLKACMVK